MTDTPSKREQAREERRRQILNAALEVFAAKGFHAANVSDVAAQAGVSQGTIYWYFESKDELFNAAILAFFVDFGQGMVESLQQFETASDRLRALGQAMEEFVQTAEGLFTLFLSYWSSSSRRDEAGQIWVDMLIQYKDVIVTIIQEGIDRGEFRPVDAEQFVWALMAAYDGLAAYIMLMPDLDFRRISQVFVDVLLAGLKVDAE